MLTYDKIEGNDSIKGCLEEFKNCFPGLLERVVSITNYADKLSRFACVRVIKDGNDPIAIGCFYDNDFLNYVGYITLIGVKSDFRGNGYGKLLMNHIMKECKEKGMRSIKLEVDDDNEKAIGFYKSLGFSISERARNNSFYMIMSL